MLEFSSFNNQIYLIIRKPEYFEFQKYFINTYQLKISYTLWVAEKIYYVYIPVNVKGLGVLYVLNNNKEPKNVFLIKSLRFFYLIFLKKLVPGMTIGVQRIEKSNEMLELAFEHLDKKRAAK